jgi:hypothetical protein
MPNRSPKRLLWRLKPWTAPPEDGAPDASGTGAGATAGGVADAGRAAKIPRAARNAAVKARHGRILPDAIWSRPIEKLGMPKSISSRA